MCLNLHRLARINWPANLVCKFGVINMPSYSRKVTISGKTSQELYDKVSEGIDRFMSKTPVGKYEIERVPGKKELKVKSSMFNATLTCTEGQMELSGNLSLLASPFKSKLDEAIDRWLSKTFDQSMTT